MSKLRLILGLVALTLADLAGLAIRWLSHPERVSLISVVVVLAVTYAVYALAVGVEHAGRMRKRPGLGVVAIVGALAIALILYGIKRGDPETIHRFSAQI